MLSLLYYIDAVSLITQHGGDYDLPWDLLIGVYVFEGVSSSKGFSDRLCCSLIVGGRKL